MTGTVRRDYDNRFMTSAVSVNGEAIAYIVDNDGLVTRAGNLAATWRPDNGLLASVSLDFLTSDFGYSTYGERSSENHSYPGRPLYREDYSRDALGRIETRTVTAETTTVFGYTYDGAGRLRQVLKNGALSEDYLYDDNGNRTASTVRGQSRSATYDAQDRLLALGDVSYTYNENGDLTAKTSPSGTAFFLYDALGNLRSATRPSGETLLYTVDAQNRRLGKRLFDSSGTLLRAQGFLYDGQLRIVAELDGDNRVTSRFVYATRPTTPDFMIRGGITYRIITDHVGSPVRVVDARTGTTVQSISYDSFGVVLEDTNPGFQPFGFAGGLYDQDTRLVRFGARDYDPESGRWTAKDPIGFGGGDTNLYGYVINDPMNWIDATGLAAGDPYSSPDAAALAALKDAHQLPGNAEWGGRVYKEGDHYSYTPARTDGKPNEVSPGPLPQGTIPAGTYHTHTDTGFPGESPFSDADHLWTKKSGLPEWMVDSAGQTWKTWFKPPPNGGEPFPFSRGPKFSPRKPCK